MHPVALVVLMAPVPVLELALKLLVGRPRPTGHGLGFPSGHAIASLTLVLLVGGSLWPLFPRGKKVAIALIAAAFLLTVAIGRVGQSLHWPSDIVGGWLVALTYARWTLPFIDRSRRTT